MSYDITQIDKKNAFDAAADLLKNAGVAYAAISGLDGKPAVSRVDFCFAHEGGLYFHTLKSTLFYGGLSLKPNIQILAEDPARGIQVVLSAKAVFTENDKITELVFKAKPELEKQLAGDRRPVIAYFLSEITAEFSTLGGISDRKIKIPDPTGAVMGIKLAKKTELRDRLVKVFSEHAAAADEEGYTISEAGKLLDGAMLVFAEAAKKLWPRMDVFELERSLRYDTYDERERYTALARELIGGAEIKQPEDITYWLSPETLGELSKE